MILCIFWHAFQNLGFSKLKSITLFLFVISGICLADDVEKESENDTSAQHSSLTQSDQKTSTYSYSYDDYDFGSNDDGYDFGNNHDDFSSFSQKISFSPSFDDVMVLSENETKTSDIPASDFSDEIFDSLNKLEQATFSRSENYDIHITEPQMHAERGTWKSTSLGSHTETKPEITLGPQPLATPTIHPKIAMRLKVSSVSHETDKVISALKECSSLSAKTEKLLALDNLAIKESTNLDKHLKEAINNIQHVVYEPDGWIRSGSGRFVGINSSKDVEKINLIIDKFEHKVELWKHDSIAIREDIIYDSRKISPKYIPSKPYNEKWDNKIKNEPYNKDLKQVIAYRDTNQIQQAEQIVKKYESQIPRAKDGSLKAGRKFNQYSDINRLYQKVLDSQRSLDASKNSLSSIGTKQHIKATEQTTRNSILTAQKSNEQLQKELGIAAVLKTLNKPDNFFELPSERLISQDFITTVRGDVVKFDDAVFKNIMNDQELADLIREVLQKKEFVIAKDTFKQPSVLEQCDEFLKDYAQACKQIQQAALKKEYAVAKYSTIGFSEIHKKTAELGQSVLHPQETFENFMEGLENIAQFCVRIAEIDMHVELQEFDVAHQKRKQLSEDISATLNAIKNLSDEEKFKLAIGVIYDWKVTCKLFDKAGTLANSLKNTAQEVANTNNIQKLGLLPEQVKKLTKFSEVCEKRAIQLDKFAQTINDHEKSIEALARLNATVEEITQLEKTIQKLRPLFDETRKGFGEFANKYIKIPYRHILTPEIKITKDGLRLLGYHHDYLNALEKSGIIKITNKVMGKDGFYKADVWFNGKSYKNKTFFPSHWQREKVIGTVMEAYDSFISKGAKNYKIQPDGKFLAKALTKEGIPLDMYITKKGHLKSGYPSDQLFKGI